MTEKELNSIRELNKQIRRLEKHLQALRLSAENLVPILDGLPHSNEAKSRVEKIALMIISDERELDVLRAELDRASEELPARIHDEVSDVQERTILLLRYVACMRFRDIAFQLDMSERRVFQIHHDALQSFS